MSKFTENVTAVKSWTRLFPHDLKIFTADGHQMLLIRCWNTITWTINLQSIITEFVFELAKSNIIVCKIRLRHQRGIAGVCNLQEVPSTPCRLLTGVYFLQDKIRQMLQFDTVNYPLHFSGKQTLAVKCVILDKTRILKIHWIIRD